MSAFIIPHKIALGTICSGLVFIGGVIAHASKVESRVITIEERSSENFKRLRRVEKMICLLCVHELGSQSCPICSDD